MTKDLRSVLDVGSLGFFWSPTKWPPDLNEEPERGWIRIEGDAVTIDVLDEDPVGSINRFPGGLDALVGVLPEDSLLLLELHPTWATHRFGTVPRASSKQYRARTVIGNVPVDELRSPRLLGLSANFHGVGRWAGMSASREEWTTSKGLIRGWSIQLSEGEELSAPLSRGRVLEVTTSWRVDGPTDQRAIAAPIVIGCTAKRPKDTWALLEPLLHVQNLLSVAFRGLVVAEGGAATVDVESTPGPRQGAPTMWSAPLNARPETAIPPPSMTKIPLFDLASLGGIHGLARWISLSDKHPRAVNPVTGPLRRGWTSPEVTVLETAAAIEYWVKVNRPSKWAAGKPSAQATATRAGKPFAEWVGDPEAWAKAYWRAYNDLKHNPAASMDQNELVNLALSGQHLLTAVLVDRAAGSAAPSRSIFRHHRLHDLGGRLRDRFS